MTGGLAASPTSPHCAIDLPYRDLADTAIWRPTQAINIGQSLTLNLGVIGALSRTDGMKA
jgi:hypothetical protein